MGRIILASPASSSSKSAEVRIHPAFCFAEKKAGSEGLFSLSVERPEIPSTCSPPSHRLHPRGRWPLGSSWDVPAALSQELCPQAAERPRSIRAGRTKHRGVVLGEDLILGPVGKHVDEIAQVPQPVSQRPNGEVPCGERLQVPQVAVSCEKDTFIPTPTTSRGGSGSWGLRLGL